MRVVDADCRIEDAPNGDTRVYFDLILADPASDEETWPLDDLLALQGEVDQLAVEADLNVPWQVSIGRQSPEQYDEDPSSEV